MSHSGIYQAFSETFLWFNGVQMTCALPLQVYFGQNMIWNRKDSSARGAGKVLQVGDPVYVIRKVSSAAEAAA